MKRVMLMVALSLIPRLLVAQELDVASLAGEDWYGLYLNGQKMGYAHEMVAVEDDGSVTASNDAYFRLSMMGVSQEMNINEERAYAADGPVRRIVQKVKDNAGEKIFDARVEGGGLTLRSTVGGQSSEKNFPAPKESLEDAFRLLRLVREGAKKGDEVRYSAFEPMYEKEIHIVSTVKGVEERMFEGARVKVYRVHSTIRELGITSDAYIMGDGTVLEDTFGGIITMRLEPEEVAKDVDYTNDVIVSNAAKINAPIVNPRTRDVLKLRIWGPLTEDHLFNDERQSFEAAGDRAAAEDRNAFLKWYDSAIHPERVPHYTFTSKRITLDGFETARLPIDNPEVAEWLKPTLLVQSDDERLVGKAKEVVGGETDAAAVSEKLCLWVRENMRTTYSAQLTNALEVLERLEGDCTEHSILYIGLARAAGLPAREVAGLVYVPGGEGGFYFHQWAKAWVGKWIDVDPTFGQPLADVTHIKLAEGDLFSQSKLIPAIGRLEIELVEDVPDS